MNWDEKYAGCLLERDKLKAELAALRAEMSGSKVEVLVGKALKGHQEPFIKLTRRQTEMVAGKLAGMTLAGAMALAVKDEDKFKTIYDRQQAIIHALLVLGIPVEISKG